MPVKKSSAKTELIQLNKSLGETIQGYLDDMIGEKNQKGIIREQPIILDRMYKLISASTASLSGGQQAFDNNYSITKKMLGVHSAEVQQFLNSSWEDYKAKVNAMNLNPFNE